MVKKWGAYLVVWGFPIGASCLTGLSSLENWKSYIVVLSSSWWGAARDKGAFLVKQTPKTSSHNQQSLCYLFGIFMVDYLFGISLCYLFGVFSFGYCKLGLLIVLWLNKGLLL